MAVLKASKPSENVFKDLCAHCLCRPPIKLCKTDAYSIAIQTFLELFMFNIKG